MVELGVFCIRFLSLTLSSFSELLSKHYFKKVLVAQWCPTLCDPVDCSPQAPLSIGFSRQEYWSELLLPSPADLSDPGIEPQSTALLPDSLPSEPPGKPVYFKWSLILS